MEKFFTPASGICTWGTCEHNEDLDNLEADVAVLGLPIDMGASVRPGARFGPRAMREASVILNPTIDGCYDFERDEVFLHPDEVKMVDAGDVPVVTGDLIATHKLAEDMVRKIVARGAFPAVIGGDHSCTIPVVRGLDAYDDLCIIQFDAHLDWSKTSTGQLQSHSSPMRRSSELPFVTKMCQIGIRGMGSSRKTDFDDARAFGSVIISAKEARKLGSEGVLAKIPKAKNYFVTLDIDGLDASIASGTGTPAGGGLDFDLVDEILYGVAQMGNPVGFDICEVAPSCDQSGITERIGSVLMMNYLGYAMKQRKKLEK